MKLRTNRNKVAVGLGTVMAGVAFIATSVPFHFMKRTVEMENRSNVQQSIGDTTAILSNYFNEYFRNLVGQTYLLGAHENRRIQVENRSPETLGNFIASSDIIDISIWQFKTPVSAFDLFPQLTRISRSINTQFPKWTPELQQKILESEITEREKIQFAIKDRVVISLSQPLSQTTSKVVLIAAPLGKNENDPIAVIHLVLGSFKNAFNREGMISSYIVDSFGRVITSSNGQSLGKNGDISSNPLYSRMSSSDQKKGQLLYSEQNSEDQSAVRYFGGYSKIDTGNLSVIGIVSESEVMAGADSLRRQYRFYLALNMVLSFIIGFVWLTRSEKLFKWISENSSYNPIEDAKSHQPQRSVITVVHGTFRYLNQLSESESPNQVADSLNDFWMTVGQVVRNYGGTLELIGGKAFIASWGVPRSDGTEVWCGLRCAVAIREGLIQLNSSRKVDGHKPITYTLGVHMGIGFAARLGPGDLIKYKVIGDVVQCASSLDYLAFSKGVDLLISQEIWLASEAKFIGDQLGEVKLTSQTGLTGFFAISGYRNQEGKSIESKGPELPAPNSITTPDEVPVADLIVKDKVEKRWMVNNGTQMEGPYTAKEIASRLFVQELDFDSEVWEEGTGVSAQIKTAGIFSGSEDAGAKLWFYDGEMVHGPISPGFLKTALRHGALPSAAFLCEGSTISGWKPLEQCDPSFFPSHQEDLGKDAELRASLEPPKEHPSETTQDSLTSGESTTPPVAYEGSDLPKKAA